MYQEDNGGRQAGGKLDGILLFREESILGFYAKKSVFSHLQCVFEFFCLVYFG